MPPGCLNRVLGTRGLAWLTGKCLFAVLPGAWLLFSRRWSLSGSEAMRLCLAGATSYPLIFSSFRFSFLLLIPVSRRELQEYVAVSELLKIYESCFGLQTLIFAAEACPA